jgi:hypothetical protein
MLTIVQRRRRHRLPAEYAERGAVSVEQLLWRRRTTATQILQLRLQGNTNDANSRTCQQQCALSKGCVGIVFTPDSTNAT